MNVYSTYRCLTVLLVCLFGSVVLSPQGARAAGLNAFASLTADGTSLEGEPTVLAMGGDDVSTAIECHSAVYELYLKASNSSVANSGAAVTPVTIRKRVDKSSPLLAKALMQNEVVEGEIRFYMDDAGATVRFYTRTLTGGRVSAIRSWLPDRTDPATANYPQLEEVSFVYTSLTVTDERSGTSYVINAP